MKRNIYIALICLVLIAVIIVCFKGFNVGLEYAENTSITVNLGKQFDKKDIRAITKEVFPNEKVIIQTVEIYKEAVQITVKDVSDEQLETLNTKINEKYELENEVSNIEVIKNTNTRLRDVIKHYVLPVIIASIAVLAYELLRFRKQGLKNILYIAIVPIVLAQVLLACVYAICRIPVNSYTCNVSLILYIISELFVYKKLLKGEISEKSKKSK